MAYRSWLKYGDVEIANSARVGGLASIATPSNDALIFGAGANSCSCSAGLLEYPDWWTGQETYLGDNYADITDAPWYNPARCESSKFHGIMPVSVEGLDTVAIDRSLIESFCDGGHPSRHRDRSRTIRVEAMLIACDHAAATFGLQWLTCQLRQARATRGADLQFLAASPQDSCVDPDTLLRSCVDVVLLQEPQITDMSNRGYGGKSNRHGSIWRVEWIMGTGNPYAYGPPINIPVVFDEDIADPLVWSTVCVGDGGCPEPVTSISNPDCPPITLPEPANVPVGCTHDSGAGCTPLCEGRRRVWTFDPPAGASSACGETVLDIWVTNSSLVTPVYGVNLAWIPCGGDQECDRVSDITITYIPPGAAVVLDSVRGRPRVFQDGQFYQAAGLVRGPNGPWSGLALDSMMCWELLLDTDPGTEVDISIWARSRDV